MQLTALAFVVAIGTASIAPVFNAPRQASTPKPSLRVLVMPLESTEGIAQRAGDRAPKYWTAWGEFAAALASAGVLEGGNALEPQHLGRTVALLDGKVQAAPTPAATKPQFSGYFVLNVKDWKEAEAWAAKCPSLQMGGAVELRPLLPPMGPLPVAGAEAGVGAGK